MTLHGPNHRSILVIDIEGSTTRTNLIRFELRRLMYQLLVEAMASGGIDGSHCELPADRGDGVLVLILPVDAVPRSRLLHLLMPMLARRLMASNERLRASDRIARRIPIPLRAAPSKDARCGQAMQHSSAGPPGHEWPGRDGPALGRPWEEAP